MFPYALDDCEWTVNDILLFLVKTLPEIVLQS